jgi:hypothetical protein
VLVRYMFGNKRKIRITAYYAPVTLICLFSPQAYFKEKNAGSLLITHDRKTLTIKDVSSLELPYQENNLPLVLKDEHFLSKTVKV